MIDDFTHIGTLRVYKLNIYNNRLPYEIVLVQFER